MIAFPLVRPLSKAVQPAPTLSGNVKAGGLMQRDVPQRQQRGQTLQTSHPLAQDFIGDQGVSHHQEDPLARQQVQPASRRPQSQVPKQLSTSPLLPQRGAFAQSVSTEAPAKPRPQAQAAVPAYPRARELEHQRRLLQEMHQQQMQPRAAELREAPQTPRMQARKGTGPSVAKSPSRSVSPARPMRAPSTKAEMRPVPKPEMHPPPRRSKSPSTPPTQRAPREEAAKALVEPVTSLGGRAARSPAPSPSNCGPKEVRTRAPEQSVSPLLSISGRGPKTASAVRLEGSAPTTRQGSAKGTTSASGCSPRSQATCAVKAKPRPKASSKSVPRPVSPSPLDRPHSPAPRDLSPPAGRLPRKPPVPQQSRSQTPPKSGLASYLPGGQTALIALAAQKVKASTPLGPGRGDFADKVAALPSQASAGNQKVAQKSSEQSGRIYMGFRDGQGQRNGYGVMQVDDGTTYTGQWCGSKREGYGTLFFKGGVFEGQWLQGSAHGKGSIHFQNGDTFDGTYAHNKKSGHGVYTWAGGTRESGEYVEGQKDGVHLWRSASESWEVVYDKGALVATRRVDGGTEAQAPEEEADTSAQSKSASADAHVATEMEAPKVLDKAWPGSLQSYSQCHGE